MSDSLRHFRVVLCNPRFSGNIGFVCRAMKAMGIRELAIVGDQSIEDASLVRATAVHAADIYESALRIDSLSSAVSDCVFVAGTARRRG